MSDHIWSGYEVVELGTIESDLIISAHMDHSHVQVYMLAFPSHCGIGMTSRKFSQPTIGSPSLLRPKMQSRIFMEQLICPTEISTKRMRIMRGKMFQIHSNRAQRASLWKVPSILISHLKKRTFDKAFPPIFDSNSIVFT